MKLQLQKICTLASVLTLLIISATPAEAKDGPVAVMSAEQSMSNLISKFIKVGTARMYDDPRFEESIFDLHAYVAHQCYGVTKFEYQDCYYEFGKFADLQTTLLNGDLKMIIESDDSIADKDVVFGEIAIIQANYEMKQKRANARARLASARRTRETQLWSTCLQKNKFWSGPSAKCYIRNMSALRDPSKKFSPTSLR